MKAYRKVSGVYFECASSSPVSATMTPVARRPSALHVFADEWASDPMNPTVCWRLMTASEQNAAKDADLQAYLDSVGGKVAKTFATVLIQKGVCTMAELRTIYRAL